MKKNRSENPEAAHGRAERSFEESGLLFTFSAAWNVRPFDDHRYYRWLSGRGLRGVDFVGIYQGRLVLMEVKNYRRREGMRATDAFQVVRQDPAGFSLRMAEKVSGSLRVIRAVHDYYRRRWWFWWFERLPAGWKRRYPQSYFWHVVAELAVDPGRCVFVLWLDADSDTDAVEKEIMAKLTGSLDGMIEEVIVSGQKKHPFGNDVLVEMIWKD